MPLDPNATVKDYTLIIYNKTEIDDKSNAETLRVNLELGSKVTKQSLGSPTGTAQLGQDAKHKRNEIPFSAVNDAVSLDTVMSPARTTELVNAAAVLKTDVATPNGVAPLDSTGKVPYSSLPPAQHNNTNVVATLQDMYDLVPNGNVVNVGDRAIVTSEAVHTDNGEYVAEIDSPVDASGWKQLPNLSTVGSVNGQTGTVVITSITESAANKILATAADSRSTTNAAAIVLLNTKTQTLEYVAGDSANIDPDLQANHVNTISPILVAYTQNIDGDITIAKASKELITVGNAATLVENLYNGLTNTGASTPLLADGSVEMETGYTPIADLDIATRGYITEVQAKHTYDYVKDKDIVITGNTTFNPVSALTTPVRDAGTYEIKFSTTTSYNSTTSSYLLRWSIDGGNAWETYSFEPKDITDRRAHTYEFPIVHTGGAFDIQLEGKVENINKNLTIYFSNIIVERKV